jgi:hypothetical protein
LHDLLNDGGPDLALSIGTTEQQGEMTEAIYDSWNTF